MNEHSREALDAYYEEAASWNRDRLQSIDSSRRIAWCVAGGAAATAILEAFALVALAPLKTVEPYTLMVDRTTGYVQALKPLEQAKIAPDAALTQSFLVQYVVARESFDMATLAPNYRKVALFSAGRARSSYLEAMQASNRASPLAIYPRSTKVEVRVKSVSPIAPDTALVRFETVRVDEGPNRGAPSAYVAVLKYRYATDPMKLEDRFVNPLGFQVFGYRRDPEALPAAEPAASTVPPPAPVLVESPPPGSQPRGVPLQAVSAQ